jgi:hypothetical protein
MKYGEMSIETNPKTLAFQDGRVWEVARRSGMLED